MHVRTLLFLAASFALQGLQGAGAAPGGQPVSLEFSIDSPPGAGKTATLTAKVSVDYGLPVISVTIEPPAGARLLDSPAELIAEATPDSPVVFRRRVVFRQPGWQLARAVAKVEERPGVVWSCVRYVGVDVGASSGRIIAANEKMPAAVERVKPGDGVAKGRPGASAIAKAQAAAASVSIVGVTPAAEHPLVVGGRWMFHDRSDTLRGIALAEVKLFRGSDGAILAEAETDENGSFLFPLIENPGPAGVFVRIYSLHGVGTDERIIVNVPNPSDSWSGAYGGDTDVMAFADGTHDMGSWTIANGSYGEQAWWILDDICGVGDDMCGWHVGDLRIYWSPTNTDGTYTTIRIWDDKSFNIFLLGGDAEDTPDALLHQVGHARRWNSSTGIRCNDNPFVETGQNSAFVEGWADAWAMWATNDPVKNYPGGGSVNLETPTWGDGGDTGDAVRARVAGALWDMGDTTDDGYDRYEFDWCRVEQLVGHFSLVNSLSEGWQNWVDMPWLQQDALACLYQNTINYNTPPVFNALPSVTMDEDEDRENVIALRSYASDAESTDEELLFAITSASPAAMGISIDADGCVDIHPAANWYGSAVVTISCSDAIETLYRSFAVTVASVNDFPKLTGVPDITTPEDTPRPNAIYLPAYASDVDDSLASLTYAIVNTPDAGAGVTIDSGNYLDLSPAANWYGSTSVSVQVTDPHGLAAADVFTVTVTSVNDEPSISGLPNRSLPEDTSLDNTIDLWSYASDVETSDANLTFSVSHNTDSRSGVTIDADRYIDINPAPDWDGIADVTIRARDPGGLYGEDTFRVTVTGSNDPPTLTGLPDVLAPRTAGVSEAFDLDAYGSDPESPDSALVYTITSVTDEYAGVNIDPNHCIDVGPKLDWTGFSDVTVRVTDPFGLWAEDTFRVVVANLYPTIAEARANPDGTWVGLNQRLVSSSFADRFYIQDPSRASGIGVSHAGGFALDRQVKVAGPLSTSFAERLLAAYLLTDVGAAPPVRPLVMNNGEMGGSAPDASTPAVPLSAHGLYNVGLLVQTTGKVIMHISTTAFYIWDGSAVVDSRPATQEPWLRVAVPPSGWRPPVGSWVTVTGISGAGTYLDNTIRILRPRGDDDIVVNLLRVAFIYRSNQAEGLFFKSILDANHLPTDLIPFGAVATMNWSKYHVVIVGNDTGPWTGVDAKYVTAAGTPVVGVGAGGALFFDALTSPDLYLGTTNSTPIGGQTMVVVTGGDIYAYPYALPSTPGTTIEIASPPGITAASLSDPAGVTLRMLRQYTDGTRYLLAGEDSRFYQWGLFGQPDKWTDDGRRLFVNLMYRTVRP